MSQVLKKACGYMLIYSIKIRNFKKDIFHKIHYLLNYQKRHIAFLAQVLDYFNVDHLLSEMLSTRSYYNTPDWI